MANAPLINSAVRAGLHDQIKQIEGWITFMEAATLLGLTHGGMCHVVWSIQPFDFDTDVRALHDPAAVAEGVRTKYLLRREAVDTYRIKRSGHRFSAAASPAA